MAVLLCTSVEGVKVDSLVIDNLHCFTVMPGELLVKKT